MPDKIDAEIERVARMILSSSNKVEPLTSRRTTKDGLQVVHVAASPAAHKLSVDDRKARRARNKARRQKRTQRPVGRRVWIADLKDANTLAREFSGPGLKLRFSITKRQSKTVKVQDMIRGT